MKKALAILLVLVLVVGLMAGCGKTEDAGTAAVGGATGKDILKDDIKIAYIPVSTAGANFEISQLVMDEIMSSYKNVHINAFDVSYDPTTQISVVNDCVAQGYDAIVMECTDEVALTPVLEEAEKKGVVIITTNMTCGAVHSAYCSNYSYDAGWKVGEMMVEKMGTSGKIILLDCPAAMVSTTLHGKGFQDYIAQYPDIEMIDYANIDGFSQEIANTTMRDMLTKHDKIDAVYAMGDDMALGVVQAIEYAGRGDEGILVYGSEGMPAAIQAIYDGRLTGTVWGDRYPLLYTAFNNALLYIESGYNGYKLGYTSTPYVRFPFQAITKENVEDMWPLLRYSSVELVK